MEKQDLINRLKRIGGIITKQQRNEIVYKCCISAGTLRNYLNGEVGHQAIAEKILNVWDSIVLKENFNNDDK